MRLPRVSSVVLATALLCLLFEPSYGQLVLNIDQDTGQTQITNPFPMTVELNGYTIESLGSLDPLGWFSLEDNGLPGWEEIVLTKFKLSEFNLTDSSTFMQFDSQSLGMAYDPLVGLQDLTFEYTAVNGSVNQGFVEFVVTVPEPATSGIIGCLAFLVVVIGWPRR
ncbi:MAG: hypothetical protein ACR2NU_14660 [Aeoliella sp.]